MPPTNPKGSEMNEVKVETTRFGPIYLDDRVFIRFPWGVPGFENLKRFVLLEHRQGPFQWLQSVDDPEVAFVVCPPESVGVSYRIPEERKRTIDVERQTDFLVLTMVSFDHDTNAVRIHLRGPVLFNVASRLAYQWTIDSKDMARYIQGTENGH
jgi:flagellar assembly factor FliW